jgi:hypothetical protein
VAQLTIAGRSESPDVAALSLAWADIVVAALSAALFAENQAPAAPPRAVEPLNAEPPQALSRRETMTWVEESGSLPV